MTGLTGRCLCGAVHYSIMSDQPMVILCHCAHCRRQSGSAFSVNAILPDSQYAQTGETAIFRDRGESGSAVDRHFCGTCGSSILTRAQLLPGMVAVKVGTLDTPNALPPVQEIYCRDAFSWLPALTGNARSDGAPPMPE